MNNDDIYQLKKNIPTAEEICVYGTLEERTAVEHFFTRSVSEIEALFKGERGEAAFYGEDLTYMGPKAFQYYFPAYLHYIESSEAEDDFETAQSVIGTIYSRMMIFGNTESILPIKEEVIRCLRYIVNHPDKFHLVGELETVFEEGKHMLAAVERL